MKPLILIIEDEQAQASILQYNLEAADFRVKHAINGEEGLLFVKEDVPNLT